MTRRARRAARLACAAILLLAPAAAAQTPAASGWPRVYVALDGTYRAVYDPVLQALTFEEFVEDARVEAAFEARRRPTYGVTVGARIWRALGVGIDPMITLAPEFSRHLVGSSALVGAALRPDLPPCRYLAVISSSFVFTSSSRAWPSRALPTR